MSAGRIKWRRGQIVVVGFPYVDALGNVTLKGRPALVVSGNWVNEKTADVILAAISSRLPRARYPTDYEIRAGTETFARSGLKVTSIVKGAVIATLPQSSIRRLLGRLDRKEMQEVANRLRCAIEI